MYGPVAAYMVCHVTYNWDIHMKIFHIVHPDNISLTIATGAVDSVYVVVYTPIINFMINTNQQVKFLYGLRSDKNFVTFSRLSCKTSDLLTNHMCNNLAKTRCAAALRERISWKTLS